MFDKSMDNVRKYRNSKLANNDKRRKYLVSEYNPLNT